MKRYFRGITAVLLLFGFNLILLSDETLDEIFELAKGKTCINEKGDVYEEYTRLSIVRFIARYLNKVGHWSINGAKLDDKGKSTGKYFISTNVDWQKKWEERVIKVDGYKGTNVIGIDF